METGAELIVSHHDSCRSCFKSNQYLLDAALTCPIAQFVVYPYQWLWVRLLLNNCMKIWKRHWNTFLKVPKTVKWPIRLSVCQRWERCQRLGLTGVAVVLDACIQTSNIIIPFLDTIISGLIGPDETKFSTCLKGKGFNGCVYFIFPVKFWNQMLLSFHTSNVT